MPEQGLGETDVAAEKQGLVLGLADVAAEKHGLVLGLADVATEKHGLVLGLVLADSEPERVRHHRVKICSRFHECTFPTESQSMGVSQCLCCEGWVQRRV